MKRLVTLITLAGIMFMGTPGVGAQSLGSAIFFEKANVACDGSYSFDVKNPDKVVEGTAARVSVESGFTTQVSGPVNVSLIKGQVHYSGWLDPAGWNTGKVIQLVVRGPGNTVERSLFSLICSDEPTPTPVPTRVPLPEYVSIASITRDCQDLYSQVTFVIRNSTSEDSWIDWRLTSSFTEVETSAGTQVVGPKESRTFTTGPIGTQYQGTRLRLEVYPEEFDGVEASVGPCTAVDPGPQPTVPVVPTPTLAPAVNAFKLTAANRACADQRFSASWTGSNLQTVEFALSNTSDEWTSGWMSADAASGTFSGPVDHHGYDKVMARATFTDGSTAQQDADVGTCTEAPAPPAPQPTVPAPSKPSPSQSGGVTNLPKTGAGTAHGGIMLMASVLLSAAIVAGVGLHKRSHI